MLSGEAVRAAARASRFSLVGLARAEPLDPRPLEKWLAAGYAADMSWMASRMPERLDPTTVLPGARTVIALAIAYHRPAGETGAIARYARGRDYHYAHRDRMRRLRKRLLALDPTLETYACADTGVAMEKVWAERAGLGWIGKNGCLINPRLGIVADAVGDVRRPRGGQLRRARRAALRRVQPVPDRLPDGRVSGAGRRRRAPLRRLPEHRKPGRRAGAAAIGGLRRAHLRLRRLPGGLPVESPPGARRRRALRTTAAGGAAAGGGGGADAGGVEPAWRPGWRWLERATTGCAGTRSTRSAARATAAPATSWPGWSTIR